jgi:hypothetical protein
MNADELQGIAPAPDAEPTEIEAVAETEVVESESSTDEVQTEETPKAKGVQKRLDELTRNWREEQRRAQKLEQMLEQVISRPQEQKPEPSAPPQPQGEPKLDQYQTYEEYVSALADYKADQKIRQFEESIKQREQQSQQQAKLGEFQARLQAAKTEMPDFDEVALNPSLPVSDSMAELIREMDDGPKVLYALGQNPNEAARIASLPPTLAAVELGRFAVKASLPQPKTVTNAPPPVNPLSGGVGSRNPDPDSQPIEEWVRQRNQQLYSKR